MPNFATIANHTIDVQKIIDIEWYPSTETHPDRDVEAGGAVILFTRGIIVLSTEQAAALRWYMNRIWKPVDIEQSYTAWREQQPRLGDPVTFDVDGQIGHGFIAALDGTTAEIAVTSLDFTPVEGEIRVVRPAGSYTLDRLQ